MKMKFLSVFCVVLCLHIGVTTSNQNYAPDVLYGPPTTTKDYNFQTNHESLYNQHNLIDNPTSPSGQSHKVTKDSPGVPTRISYNPPTQILKDPNLKSEHIKLEPRGLSPKTTEIEKDHRRIFEPEPKQKILSRTLLKHLQSEHRKNMQNEGLLNRPYEPSRSKEKMASNDNLAKGNIPNSILHSAYNNPNYLDTGKKVVNINQNRPSIDLLLKSEGQSRFDVQRISLEKIKSLINMQEQHLTKDSNLDKDKYTSIRYIIKKAKNLQKIHSSEKNLKQYIIMHPNGTVEHIDKLDKIAKRYPNYLAIKSGDLSKYAMNIPKSQSALKKQKVNDDAVPKTSYNLNVDIKPPNKNVELLKNSLEKENSASTADINQKENPLNSQDNQLAGDDNTKNLDQTVLNVPLSSSSSETTPTQNFTNTIPVLTHTRQDNPGLEKSINVLPNSEVTSKENNNNHENSPFSWVPVNVHGDKTANLNSTSRSSSPIPNLADIDHSGLWFQDNDFWDKLKNDTNNVFYFMFVPTSPQVKKETKTTIYCNGTTIEEVIEIVDGKDGLPISSKTSKVTHADGCN